MSESANPAPVIPILAGDLSQSVRLGLVRAEPVEVGPSGPQLQAEIEKTRARLVNDHSGRVPGEIPGLEPARKLYRTFGIDPTRTRPSSEALLRRVLSEKPLPVILDRPRMFSSGSTFQRGQGFHRGLAGNRPGNVRNGRRNAPGPPAGQGVPRTATPGAWRRRSGLIRLDGEP